MEEGEVTCWSLLSPRFTYAILCYASSLHKQHIHTWTHALAPKPPFLFSSSENGSTSVIPSRRLGVWSLCRFSHLHIPRFLADNLSKLWLHRLKVFLWTPDYGLGCFLVANFYWQSPPFKGWTLLPMPQWSTWSVACQTWQNHDTSSPALVNWSSGIFRSYT